MSGASGRTVVDEAIVARVRALAVSWGSTRRLGSAIGIRRTTIDVARAGRPLSPRAWRRLASAIADVPDSPPSGCLLPIPVKSHLCERCGKRRVRALGLDGRRTICRDCRDAERSSKSTRSACQHCGYKHGDKLQADFCCIFVPDKPGECGWCGDDSILPFCSKPCSVAYHADRSNGLFGEAMVRSDDVAAE